jgi:hypothetical protein
MGPPVRKGLRTLRNEGVGQFGYQTLRYLDIWTPLWNTVTSRYPPGTNVFEREWDLLVVLDACRADTLREFTDTYPWLNSVDEMHSVGSMSAEWVLKTFTEQYRAEIERTAFISRNVWSNRIFVDRLHEHDNDPEGRNYDQIRRGYPAWNPVTTGAFRHYERVEATANHDHRLHPESTSIPHIVTDRAISVGRNVDPGRLVVWYRMPHLKLFADAVDWSPEDSLNALMNGPEPVRDLRPEEQSYDPAPSGRVSRDRVCELYRQNLALVLAYVDILLRNLDAEKAIITADHGEGLGEGGVWGHPYGYPWPPVKTVPWARTTATDEETYTSQYAELEQELVSEQRRELLEDMGYV